MPKSKPSPKPVRHDRVESNRFRRYVAANAKKLRRGAIEEERREAGEAVGAVPDESPSA